MKNKMFARINVIKQMVYLVNKDGVFERRTSEQGENAGNGVFCVKKVKAGTILPYYGITIKDEDDDNENENVSRCRTYVIAADYTTPFGNQRTVKGYSVDGDPCIPRIATLATFKKLASQINEASDASVPNCLLVSNPGISRADIKHSLAKSLPIPVTYVVTTENLVEGTELLTCYGGDYGERDYTTFKMNKRKYREMIDRAYEFVDAIQN